MISLIVQIFLIISVYYNSDSSHNNVTQETAGFYFFVKSSSESSVKMNNWNSSPSLQHWISVMPNSHFYCHLKCSVQLK